LNVIIPNFSSDDEQYHQGRIAASTGTDAAGKNQASVDGEVKMKAANETLKRITDDSGEVYYCPIGLQPDAGRPSAMESCVEASTVERYAGNLNIIE